MPAISKLAIANRSLMKLGCERISSFTDGSKAAGFFQDFYDQWRDETLESHPWKFARAEADLNALASSANPSQIYAYAFQLPADCIRVTETDLHEEEDWTQQGALLLANQPAVAIIYTRRVTDEGLFTAHFVETMACRAAKDLAYPMTGKADLIQAMEQEFDKALALARSFSAQSGGKPRLMKPTSWTKRRL